MIFLFFFGIMSAQNGHNLLSNFFASGDRLTCFNTLIARGTRGWLCVTSPSLTFAGKLLCQVHTPSGINQSATSCVTLILLQQLQTTMRTLAEIQRTFLSAPRFAVVGASKDQAKFGTRVLKWYQARELDVVPVHPKEQELEGVKAVSQLSELPSPKETSVSIITPPKVTLSILQAAHSLGVPALWLQPGAEDADVRAYIQATPGLEDKVILGGPCILVQGDGVIKSMLADVSVKSTKASSL